MGSSFEKGCSRTELSQSAQYHPTREWASEGKWKASSEGKSLAACDTVLYPTTPPKVCSLSGDHWPAKHSIAIHWWRPFCYPMENLSRGHSGLGHLLLTAYSMWEVKWPSGKVSLETGLSCIFSYLRPAPVICAAPLPHTPGQLFEICISFMHTPIMCTWHSPAFWKERDFNQKEELPSILHKSVYSKYKHCII